MTQVHTESRAVSVVNIARVDDTTDRVSVAPIPDPATSMMMMPGLGIAFDCARNTYKTGDAMTYTQTVSTP